MTEISNSAWFVKGLDFLINSYLFGCYIFAALHTNNSLQLNDSVSPFLYIYYAVLGHCVDLSFLIVGWPYVARNNFEG